MGARTMVTGWLIVGAVLGATATAGIIHTTADQSRTAASCRTTRTLVIVNLDNRRHRGTLRHAWAARASGQPTILHIDRIDADRHRDESLRGIPRWFELSPARRERLDPDHWDEPHDRDEYPPAATEEGGTGADVAYVLRADNRSAGQAMGERLAPFCAGQRWRYELKPGPH